MTACQLCNGAHFGAEVLKEILFSSDAQEDG